MVITLNGRGFQFPADDVEENNEWYEFFMDGEIVGRFLIKGISGYYRKETDDGED